MAETLKMEKTTIQTGGEAQEVEVRHIPTQPEQVVQMVQMEQDGKQELVSKQLHVLLKNR